MIIKKQFSDIGSIVKALLKAIDLQKVHIGIGLDPQFPNEICVKVMTNWPVTTMVIYTWLPGKIQYLNIPDDICLPHVLRTKITKVKSSFTRNAFIR